MFVRAFSNLLIISIIILTNTSIHGSHIIPYDYYDFKEDSFLSWNLSGGLGGWSISPLTGEKVMHVIGDGLAESHNYWHNNNILFEPNQTYILSFITKALATSKNGCVTTGPNFANNDIYIFEDWTEIDYYFKAPRDVNGKYLRFGQWKITGTVWFSDISKYKVQPIHTVFEELSLGEGEIIRNGVYEANMYNYSRNINSSRFLESYSADFNTNRWIVKNGKDIIYQHDTELIVQRSGSVTITVDKYIEGECIVEISKDKKNWIEIGRINTISSMTFKFPVHLFPINNIFIKLKGEGDQCNFHITNYTYRATIDDTSLEYWGRTNYLTLFNEKNDFPVEIISLGDLNLGGENQISFKLLNKNLYQNLLVNLKFKNQNNQCLEFSECISNDVLHDNTYTINYEINIPEVNYFEILIAFNEETLFFAQSDFFIPEILDKNFGYFISRDQYSDIWWCEPDYKIGLERIAPDSATSEQIQIYSAKNEYEAFQVVIRPEEDIDNLNIYVSDLISENGELISSENIQLYKVDYVPVIIPSDRAGCSGWWPDPLIPIQNSIDIKANINQPIWVDIYIPSNSEEGDYKGYIRIQSDNFEKEIPFYLHVWDFILPEKTHLKTSFGLSMDNIKYYHHLETEEELQIVLEKYYKNFSEHRISPYYINASIHLKIENLYWNGGLIDSIFSYKGNKCLKIIDDDILHSTSVSTNYFINFYPEKKYLLSWAVRTEFDNQKYLFSLNFYDSDTNWIPHHNLDISLYGYESWLKEEYILDVSTDQIIPENARFVKIFLRPVQWTRAGEFIGTAWFDDIIFNEFPEGMNLVFGNNFENLSEEQSIDIDFKDFDLAAEKAFNVYYFNTFRLHLQGIGFGTYYKSHPGFISSFMQGTPEHEVLFSEYVNLLQNHFEEKGWLDKAYVFWFDEPELDDYSFIREGMNLINRHAPLLKKIITEEPTESLYGYVDIWCPLISRFDPEIAEERQNLEEEIWWYLCTGPKTPYCTQFIDHNGSELRLWLWQTWKYNIDGIMIWNVNYWTSPLLFQYPNLQNPYEDAMSYLFGYGYPDGFIRYWGNGDGRFLYPPLSSFVDDEKCFDDPISSIRWKMLREGIEDYEYFWILDSLIKIQQELDISISKVFNAILLLEISDSIINNLTVYTEDPRILHNYRKKIANTIEEFQ